MAYSSFVMERTGCDAYSLLGIELRVAQRTGKPVYVVNVPKQVETPKRLPAVKWESSIDIIVTGTIAQVQSLVKRIGVVAGIIRYTGQDISEVHSHAKIARIAAESKE